MALMRYTSQVMFKALPCRTRFPQLPYLHLCHRAFMAADVSGGCPGASDLEPGVSGALHSTEHRSLLPVTCAPTLSCRCKPADSKQLPAAADQQARTDRPCSSCRGGCEGERSTIWCGYRRLCKQDSHCQSSVRGALPYIFFTHTLKSPQ